MAEGRSIYLEEHPKRLLDPQVLGMSPKIRGFIPEVAEKNERERGAAGEIRPRNGREGAADRIERADPGRGTGEKERPIASSVLIPAV